MTLDDLSQWYYLIYLLPLGLSALMILASVMGGGHKVGHHHGGFHIGHGGVRVGGHVHSPHLDLRLGHRGIGPSHRGAPPAHAAGDAHPHSSSHPAGSSKDGRQEARDAVAVHHGSKPILAFFGIGRVPGLLLLQGFALCWGVIGFYASRMFEQQGRTPALFILPAMGLAAAGGVIGARLMGSLGARLMPSEESFSAGKGDLIGSIGTSVYPISATMGRIHVFDAYGTLHDESARLCPDLTEPIARDESVILVDYDEAADCYRVERSPV